jgi:hypothetical protein
LSSDGAMLVGGVLCTVGYIQADVDGWLARALAAHLGHYPIRPPARKPPASCRRRSSHTPRLPRPRKAAESVAPKGG